MHYSAKHGIEIACHLSVRLSVTLPDQEHIGWKSWKLIARTISPTPLLFVAQRQTKRRLKIMEKTERGRIQGLPKFMRCSQLSQERLKLWTSNLAGTFAGSLRAKGHKILETKGRGRIQGLPNFFAYPLLAQERLKLWTSNLAGTFAGSIRAKGR